MSDAPKISSESPDDAPSLTPEQRTVLARCFRIDGGELQARVIRGDEDDHLAELIDAFDAYFVMSRAKLGHDRVPIMTWETYVMIKQRSALVQGATIREDAEIVA